MAFRVTYLACLVVLFAVACNGDDCAPDCLDGTDLTPHPQDCGKFYHCALGIPHKKNCPAGLNFSPETLRCDYPKQAGCTSDAKFLCGGKQPTDEVALTSPAVPSVSDPKIPIVEPTAAADTCVPKCPAPNALFPHPHDCTKYFHCAHDVPHLKSCPAGQEYSGPLVRCDHPGIAKCTAKAGNPCEAEVNPPSAISTAVPSVSDPKIPIDETTAAADTCVPKCPTPNALFPHPHDCTKYFHCAHDVPYLKPCPAGQEYSGPLVRCDYPYIAKCTAKAGNPCEAEVNPPSATEEPEPEVPQVDACAPKCPFANAYMPHPRDCTKFYICNGDSKPLVHPCQDGLLYNKEKMWCDWPEQANCVAHPERACDEFLTNE